VRWADAPVAQLRIDVTSQGLVLSRTLRRDVRRRVLLAMSRFGREVEGVTARLAESKNPLGGVDPRCRVATRLRSGLLLHAEAVDGDIATAVARSADRLALLVAAALAHRAGARPPASPAPRR
jgi:hypothetical protein